MRALFVALLVFCAGASAQISPAFPDTSRRMMPMSLPDVVATSDSLDTLARNLPWKVTLESSLGVTHSFASKNWTGGQGNSFQWIADVSASADKPISICWTFENDVRLNFGQSHAYDQLIQKWLPPQKSADRIRYDALLRRFGNVLDPYVAGSAESQFVDQLGRNDRFFNPAEFTESAGFAHYLLNQPSIRVVRSRVGAGLRERFVAYDDTANADVSHFDVVIDAGTEWVTDVDLGSPFTRYSYNSKLILFQAFYNSRAIPSDHRWQTLDVNWDNTFRANVTRVLQVSLSWQIIFDEEISKAGRFRESLALSVGYRFAR